MESILSLLANTKAFLMLAAGFCFLIFVHELGHFLAAKMVNCKVSQFAIGFGPALVSWRKGMGFRRGSTEPEFNDRIKEHFAKHPEARAGAGDPRPTEIDAAARNLGLGETEYRLNLLLFLGGYVKLLGQEDLKPDAVSDDPRSFNRMSAWARAVILSAGVFMNLVFALIFFVIAFRAGVEFPPAIVGDVMPNAPAAVAYAQGHENDARYQGLRPGDRITHANGDAVTDFRDVSLRAALTHPESTLTLTVERDGEREPLNFPITPKSIDNSPFMMIGISEPVSTRLAAEVPVPEPFARLGLKPGMSLAAVDGKPITRYDQYDTAVAAAKGKPVPVTFTSEQTRENVTLDLAAIPHPPLNDKGMPNLLGLVPATRVGAVVKKSPAEGAGVKVGDLIARIDDKPWPRRDELPQIVRAAKRRSIELTVLRDGNLVNLGQVTPTRSGTIGIVLTIADNSLYLSDILPGSPLAAAQTAPNAGSRLVSVNGQPVNGISDAQKVLMTALAPDATTTVRLGIERNIKSNPLDEVEVKVTPEQAKPIIEAAWSPPIGLAFEMLNAPLEAGTALEATKLGVLKTHQFMVQTYLSILRLVQGAVPLDQMHGMVGIAHQGTLIARERGWSYLVFFLGLISVNLVVMNFLPIPILDGGQMLFLIIEKLKGSPVSIRMQTIATYIGLALIGSLLLMTLYFDTVRLLF